MVAGEDGWPVLGLFLLAGAVIISGVFYYKHGTTNQAYNSWPTELHKYVFYEKVYSQEALENCCGQGKDLKHYDVWLKSYGGTISTIYHLTEDPPDKFLPDGKGKLVDFNFR